MNNEHLVLENENLIHKILQGFNTTIEYEDLVQDGKVALIMAANAFDPSKAKFSTFAYHCIRNYIIKRIKQENKQKHKTYSNQILDLIPCDEVGIDQIEQYNFTQEERDIIEYRMSNYTNKKIARILNITTGELTKKMERIQRKTNRYYD